MRITKLETRSLINCYSYASKGLINLSFTQWVILIFFISREKGIFLETLSKHNVLNYPNSLCLKINFFVCFGAGEVFKYAHSILCIASNSSLSLSLFVLSFHALAFTSGCRIRLSFFFFITHFCRENRGGVSLSLSFSLFERTKERGRE